MADDTRLAEACLLLNYSSQSYKEQQRSQPNAVKIKLECDQNLANETVSPKLITPPPEHEDTMGTHQALQQQCHADWSSPGSGAQLTIDNDDDFDYDDCTSPSVSPKFDTPCDYFNESYHDASREPIKNLLAAVNCALPNLKVRPNILQRSALAGNTNTISPPSYPPIKRLFDHDYCQQDQPKLSSTQLVGRDEHRLFQNRASICSTLTQEGLFETEDNQQEFAQDLRFSTTTHPSIPPKKPLKLVAVHLGAGNSRNEVESLQIAKTICEELMVQMHAPSSSNPGSRKRRKSCLNQSSTHVQAPKDTRECSSHKFQDDQPMTVESAVVQLIKRMEDHQVLNCGYGSNLNMKGQVECDASLMSDKFQMWAGVGAISGCRNPILLAKSLYDHRIVPRPLGLIQPNMLVGSGAKQWMREHCPHLNIIDSRMISSKSLSTYQKLKSRYDAAVKSRHSIQLISSPDMQIREELTSSRKSGSADQGQSSSHSSPTNLDHGFYCMSTGENLRRSFSEFTVDSRDESMHTVPNKASSLESMEGVKFHENPHESRLDTVGAVAVDSENNFACAISSGGLLLKYKGRVGQAAIPGAGCWSEDSMAATTTGVGEYLTLSLFAKKFHDKLLTLRLLYDLGHVEKKSDLSSVISSTMEECFEDLMKLPALAHVRPEERLAGMLGVCSMNSKGTPNRVDNNDLYLSYAHNTNSMCIGYMTCDDIVGHSLISRKIGNSDYSASDGGVLVRTMRFSLDSNRYNDGYFDSNPSDFQSN